MRVSWIGRNRRFRQLARFVEATDARQAVRKRRRDLRLGRAHRPVRSFEVRQRSRWLVQSDVEQVTDIVVVRGVVG